MWLLQNEKGDWYRVDFGGVTDCPRRAFDPIVFVVTEDWAVLYHPGNLDDITFRILGQGVSHNLLSEFPHRIYKVGQPMVNMVVVHVQCKLVQALRKYIRIEVPLRMLTRAPHLYRPEIHAGGSPFVVLHVPIDIGKTYSELNKRGCVDCSFVLHQVLNTVIPLLTPEFVTNWRGVLYNRVANCVPVSVQWNYPISAHQFPLNKILGPISARNQGDMSVAFTMYPATTMLCQVTYWSKVLRYDDWYPTSVHRVPCDAKQCKTRIVPLNATEKVKLLSREAEEETFDPNTTTVQDLLQPIAERGNLDTFVGFFIDCNADGHLDEIPDHMPRTHRIRKMVSDRLCPTSKPALLLSHFKHGKEMLRRGVSQRAAFNRVVEGSIPSGRGSYFFLKKRWKTSVFTQTRCWVTPM